MRFDVRVLVIVSVTLGTFVIYFELLAQNRPFVEISAEYQRVIEKRRRETNESINCHDFLLQLNEKLESTVLLIDPTILEFIGTGKCNEAIRYEDRIKVALIGTLKDMRSIDSKTFEPFQMTDDASKDYFEILADGKRIIPKHFEIVRFGELLVPSKPWRFRQFWKRSKFIDCLNLPMNRKGKQENVIDPIEASIHLSKLRNQLIDYEMFPFISEGTLLGWYRECSLIPHTNDLDMNVFANDYNPRFMEDMEKGKLEFLLARRLGKLEDSLELTVFGNGEFKFGTDIFMMYNSKNENGTDYSWIGSLCGDGERVRFNFPLHRNFCSADLHGHLVWVTCSPELMLKHEFGDKWREDLPSKQYIWHKSIKNVERVGRYSRWQMRRMRYLRG